MASIPSNGYNEVMSGSNNYTGTNSFDGNCPQTPNPPTVPNDLCNKTYVDSATGGGIIGTLTAQGSLLTGNGTNTVIFDQNPYKTALQTNTVYDWNSLAVSQSRTFTTSEPTSIPLGAAITITYSGTDNIKGVITSTVGTTITITITALNHAAYTPTTLLTTTPPDTTVVAGPVSNGDVLRLNPATTTPNTALLPARSMITSGECNVFQSGSGAGNFLIRLTSTNPIITVQRGDSSTQPLIPVAAGANPTSITWNASNGGCFFPYFTDQPVEPLIIIFSPATNANFQYPIGGGFVPPDYCGFFSGYTLGYASGQITIDDDIALIADPISQTALAWGVINTASIGAVTSVSGGTNIVMSGTIPAPVVNLRNPLTAELNIGAQSIRDSAGAVGTSGQVLTAGTGGQTLWGNNGISSITAGTNIDITGTPSVPIVGLDSPLSATLNVGSQTISSTTSAINLTPLAGQDVNVNVSNAGALHTIQTSAGGTAQPIARFNNSSASVGAVTIRTNKTGRNVATNEVIASVQFNGRNFSGVDTTFGKIECAATTATVGDTDGSLDFYSLINGVNNLVFRLNGADNENNSFRPFDLNGNNLKTSTGNMTIDTTASSGTGTLAITSKGATNITSTVSGINLTANGAGTIQLNTPSGALSTTTNSITMVATTQGVFNIPTELHYGKITTPYTNQIYRPVYQPVLTTSPHTLPVAELAQEGHQVILVNSGGDGSNELVVIPTTFFVPTCMELLQIGGSDYYVAGGYNHIEGRAEIRFCNNINGLNTDITSGNFQYVALLNGQRINCLCYDPVNIPDRIAFGGFFSAVAGVTEYRPTLFYPSSVSNILVLDIANYASIAPIDMSEGGAYTGNYYGVNGEVYCCGTRAYEAPTFFPACSAPFYVFGGSYSATVGSSPVPALNQTCFSPNGSFGAFGLRYFMIGGTNAPITMIVNDDIGRIAMGGSFSTIGVSNVDYLAYSDPALISASSWFPFASSVPPAVPDQAVTAGKALFGWRHTGFVSGTTFLVGDGGFNNNVYEGDLLNPTAGLTILKTAFPAPPRGFAVDLANPTTRYVVGYSTGGGNDYCWDFLTPHFLDLNGSVYMTNTFFEVLAIPNAPLFFKSGIEAPNAPLQFSIETPASAGNIVINSTTALPFINPAAPTLKYDRITLATYNNFAMGTLVGYGTDDARILITNSVGATFSNQ